MTKEEKDLLLIDLCSRLPYGVKVWYKYYSDNVTERFATSIRLVDRKIALSSKFNREGDWYPVEEANELLIKPYLYPMSSMTDEQEDEYNKLNCYEGRFPRTEEALDYVIANHFDYRDRISMRLAKNATGLNIY